MFVFNWLYYSFRYGKEQPTPDPQLIPQPVPDPDPSPEPIPQPDGLPSNWDSLTPQEKTDLNPFNCDHGTQHVRDDNGQCVNKPPTAIIANMGSVNSYQAW